MPHGLRVSPVVAAKSTRMSGSAESPVSTGSSGTGPPAVPKDGGGWVLNSGRARFSLAWSDSSGSASRIEAVRSPATRSWSGRRQSSIT